jgi:D-sedoheptulose 7-phosphate isomerase
MGYFNGYADEVAEGLRKTAATGSGGEAISVDEALALWSGEANARKARDGVVFFCGNGASCTMAEHLSHDCFQNAGLMTYTVSETSHITAISNDMSYEDVFAYRIGKMGKSADMLVTISSSGNSPNIVKAIRTARDKGMFVVTLSGMGAENKSRGMGDINLYAPLDTYGLVESAHAVILHGWLDFYLEKYMGGRH